MRSLCTIHKHCSWTGFIVCINHCELLLFALYHIHFHYMEDKICCLSLQQGFWANAFSCLQASSSQTPELPSGCCLEKYQNMWRELVKAKCFRIPQNRYCPTNSGELNLYFLGRINQRCWALLPTLTQWDFWPCLLPEQGHTLKLIHQSLDKFCGNREKPDNDWSWCWRCLVQTHMAAHVPRSC